MDAKLSKLYNDFFQEARTNSQDKLTSVTMLLREAILVENELSFRINTDNLRIIIKEAEDHRATNRNYLLKSFDGFTEIYILLDYRFGRVDIVVNNKSTIRASKEIRLSDWNNILQSVDPPLEFSKWIDNAVFIYLDRMIGSIRDSGYKPWENPIFSSANSNTSKPKEHDKVRVLPDVIPPVEKGDLIQDPITRKWLHKDRVHQLDEIRQNEQLRVEKEKAQYDPNYGQMSTPLYPPKKKWWQAEVADRLIKLANRLDELGMVEEADLVESFIFGPER